MHVEYICPSHNYFGVKTAVVLAVVYFLQSEPGPLTEHHASIQEELSMFYCSYHCAPLAKDWLLLYNNLQNHHDR